MPVLAPTTALVSVNDHWVEPPDLWRHVPGGPEVLTAPDGHQGWRFGPLFQPLATLGVVAEAGAPATAGTATTTDTIAVAATDPSARVAAMDADGVAVQTLLPHVAGFAGHRLAQLGDPGAWTACARTYNDAVLDEVVAFAPERFVAAAILPLHDPAAAVAELERARSRGAGAASIPHDPTSMGLPPWRDPAWGPLFDAAAAHDLALLIHLGSGATWDAVAPADLPPLGALLAAAPADLVHAVSELVFSGVLARRPALRVGLLEGGAGWVPALAERMDFFWRRRPVLAIPGSAPDRPPSDLLRSQAWFACIDDQHAIAHRHEVGLERIVWQTDFPHSDSLWPESRSHLAAVLAAVPDAEAAAIAADNARALLGI